MRRDKNSYESKRKVILYVCKSELLNRTRFKFIFITVYINILVNKVKKLGET